MNNNENDAKKINAAAIQYTSRQAVICLNLQLALIGMLIIVFIVTIGYRYWMGTS
jgi:hypothetical protein